jgi:hypothetical protein
MKVKLIDIDNPKLGNLALMKISAYHKRQGDEVGFDIGDPDKVYISCIFKWNKPLALGLAKMFDCEVEVGGYGINSMKLQDEAEHIMPDYSLYGIQYSIGFITRGCIRKCPFCDVWKKEGEIRANSPISEFLHPDHDRVIIMDNNLLAYDGALEILMELRDLTQTRGLKVCFTQGLDLRLLTREHAEILSQIDYRSLNFKERRLYVAWDRMGDEESILNGLEILKSAGFNMRNIMCYILTCFETSFDEDMYRFTKLCELGVDPYVMRYDRRGDRRDREFSRWVNRRWYKSFSFDKWERR